jgi:hypothetical protein
MALPRLENFKKIGRFWENFEKIENFRKMEK